MAAILTWVFVTLFTLLFVDAECRDLGIFGKTESIGEKSLIEQLKDRANALYAEKEEELLFELQEKYLLAARSPKNLSIPKAKKSRSFLFDPSIVVSQDIYDRERNLIAKKGARLSPLHIVSLPAPILFFDAEDLEQFSWAKGQQGKWILTGGSPFALEEEEGRPAYFDQKGELTKKFGIHSIPARVSQEGDLLLVEEIYLEEEI